MAFYTSEKIATNVTRIRDAFNAYALLVEGRTDNIPDESVGTPFLLAMAANPDFSRVDGKTANILYNPHKAFDQ